MSHTPLQVIPAAPSPAMPRAGTATRLPLADSLTAFGWRVSRQVSQCRREGGQLAVLWVEIDAAPPPDTSPDAKTHDTLIQTVSLRLRNRVRGADEVVCMGGHSFAVVLLAANAAKARLVEARLLQALSGFYGMEGGLQQVDVRIGTALFPDAGPGGAELAEAARVNLPPAATP